MFLFSLQIYRTEKTKSRKIYDIRPMNISFVITLELESKSETDSQFLNAKS